MEKPQARAFSDRLGPPYRTLASKLALPVYGLTYPPPPRMEISSIEWLNKWYPFSSKKGSLTPVDPPYEASYPEASFLCPHPKLTEERWPQREVAVPGTYIVEVPFGRTIGARGAVLTNENVLLRDLSSQHDISAPLHHLLTPPQEQPPKLRRLSGRHALIHCAYTSAYHWILDTIPRFEVLRRAGYSLDDFDGFLLRRPKYKPHYQILELLGIPEERITWCTKNSHTGCDQLVVPSFTTNFAQTAEKDHQPWVAPFLRSLAGIPEAPPLLRRRLLLNRRDSRSTVRQITNGAELGSLLAGYGFEEVVLGDLSFVEQAQIFASAEFIVAAHGGGLANLVFCAQGTKVLELFAPDYVPTHFRNIARQSGLEYEPLVMERVPNALETITGGDIRVDLAQVERTVEIMLERSAFSQLTPAQ